MLNNSKKKKKRTAKNTQKQTQEVSERLSPVRSQARRLVTYDHASAYALLQGVAEEGGPWPLYWLEVAFEDEAEEGGDPEHTLHEEAEPVVE